MQLIASIAEAKLLAEQHRIGYNLEVVWLSWTAPIVNL